jgi:hypothetical protein
VLMRNNHFFYAAQFTRYVVPTKSSSFSLYQFSGLYSYINISRNVLQFLTMHSLSNSIENLCIFFYLIFYGIDVAKCTKSTGEKYEVD